MMIYTCNKVSDSEKKLLKTKFAKKIDTDIHSLNFF